MYSDQASHTNRLAKEKSPYLLQHSHNPVDWYAWNDEAFRKAREEDKPIFLSIGYSTCHWCHVMERESFEDPDTAEILNKHFISIKVDREERPDIDTGLGPRRAGRYSGKSTCAKLCAGALCHHCRERP